LSLFVIVYPVFFPSIKKRFEYSALHCTALDGLTFTSFLFMV
jgi:hypothetical protein